jgi:DNA-binding MarR family transcriptional regulator
MDSNDTARFVMLQLRDLERVVTLLGQRKLRPRDAGVMFALMSHTDTYNGRIYVTAERLAEDLQVNPSEIRAAIGRLKREHVLRLVVEKGTGRRFYLLNPWVVQSGRPQAIGLAMKEFQAA